MTPVFCCGFECGVVGYHFTNPGAPAEISSTTVRSGNYSLRLNTTNATAYTFPVFGANNIIHTSSTRHIGRVYVYFASLPSVSTALIRFGNTITNGPQIRFNASDSKLYAAVDTTLGATGVSVTTGVWYRIDFDFNVDTSGADFCDGQINGTQLGQATAAGSSSSTQTSEAIGLFTTCTADVFFDDYITSSTPGDYPIGAGYINPFIPIADGTHNIAGTGDFQRGNTGTDILNTTTTAYQLIDDIPLPSGAVNEADCQRAVAPPNATDYVESVFGPAPGISTPTTPPRAVEVFIIQHQVGTQTGNIRVALNDQGTTDDLLNQTGGGNTSYWSTRKHYADPPSAASAWTLSGNGNFNDLRLRFYSSDAAPDQCLDAAMIEAEFAPAAASLSPPPLPTINPTMLMNL